MTESQDPIVVVVTADRYDCYGLGPIATLRDIALAQYLKEELGGVSDTVAPGRYLFNVEHLEGDTAVASLEPAPE